jgi:hypothetical protein
MPGDFANTLRWACLRWPAVLLACVLSVLAPFAESAVVRAIEGSPALSLGGASITETDDVEDEEDLYRPSSREDAWRTEHRLAAHLFAGFADDCSASCHLPLPQHRAAPDHNASGGEHAYRNGCGGPLLC